MPEPPRRVAPVALAMVILGILAELAGIALLAADRPTAAAGAVLVCGLALSMMGVVLLSMGRRR